jgi:hypothetical protein
MTAILRSQLVFETSGQRPGLPLAVSRIPFVLLALEDIANVAVEAGMRDVTYQTITQLFTQFGQLLWLLAHADCDMVLDSEAPLDLSIIRSAGTPVPYLKIARDLVPRRARRRRSLADVLDCHISAEGPDRFVELNRIAGWLAGRLVRAGKLRRLSLSPRSAFVGIQHLAIRHVSEDAIASYAGVRPATKRR